jgi:nickel-dependent lactate racemase
MKETVFDFGFGDRKMQLALPQDKIIQVIEGRSVESLADIPAAVKSALENPIGTPPLRKIVKSGEKVAIVVSDITRAWVKFDQFLPVILDELNQAGIPDSDMFIVIASGAHRANSEAENILVCGQNVCRRVRIYQHDCRNEANLSYIGTTNRGVEVYINKQVAEADRVILTGGIVYHLMAGFGGGRKAVMPGISGFKSIQGNHLFCMNKEIGKGLNPNCISGKLEDNEMNEDMTEMAALLKPDFLFNAIFTPEGKFAWFVAGHWHDAWLAGTKKVEEIYGIPIQNQADLVIASAGGFPKDINLYQGSKTIDNADMAVKPGGVIVCLLECRDIYEPKEFSNWFQYSRDLLEFEMAIRRNFTIPGFIAYKIVDIAIRNKLILVTKPENTEFMKRAGIIPATGLVEAYEIARSKLGRDDYTITVMPFAANTVPCR